MNETHNIDILEIAFNFQIEGTIQQIEEFGSGHIHETYHLKNRNTKLNDYILQRINDKIFTNVPELMASIRYVTDHLQKKVSGTHGTNHRREVLTLIPANSGQDYYQHSDGNYWRMFLFLKETYSYDLVETEKQAYEGGRGYGRFQALLSDLDVNQLYEVLPNFHDLEYRMNLLHNAIEQDPANRLKEVNDEINFVRSRKEKMMTILNMGKAGKLPLKTTHNDTKFNNVLLDRNDEAQCVIDLDTVMPGYVAYDFGDAIRTIVNTAEEDEKDLEKIHVNMQWFEGFTKGFIKEAINNLTDNEINSLAYGSLLLPFIIGIRFLTDHIDGDHYFKIHFPGHNLQRARAQFRLVERLEEKFPAMQKIIQQVSETAKTEITQ